MSFRTRSFDCSAYAVLGALAFFICAPIFLMCSMNDIISSAFQFINFLSSCVNVATIFVFVLNCKCASKIMFIVATLDLLLPFVSAMDANANASAIGTCKAVASCANLLCTSLGSKLIGMKTGAVTSISRGNEPICISRRSKLKRRRANYGRKENREKLLKGEKKRCIDCICTIPLPSPLFVILFLSDCLHSCSVCFFLAF